MTQQHETPESRIADTLAHHGIHAFTDAEGTPSIIVLHWSQDAPQDGFEDPTGGHCYLPAEILDGGVEITEGRLVHSLMVSEYDNPTRFALAVSSMIRSIAGWAPRI